jgi:hypothetical protein
MNYIHNHPALCLRMLVCVCTLQLKAGYKLVTEGKFHDALKVFIRLLQVSVVW